MPQIYDVAVIGLGAAGSAALYQLSQKKLNIIGIDQFSPPHTFGSSHGETRITRQAIGEGEFYVPLVLESYRIFEEIERKTGKKLLEKVGGLIIGSLKSKAYHGKKDFLANTIQTAKKFNIPHTIYESKDIKKYFPQFNVLNDNLAYFEPNAGFLRPEVCVATQISLAKKQGANICLNTNVTTIHIGDKQEIIMNCDTQKIQAKKLIVSAGAWVPTLFPQLKKVCSIYPQFLTWYDCSDAYETFSIKNKFPIFLWDVGDGTSIYGFPALDGRKGGIKISSELYTKTIDITKKRKKISVKDSKQLFARIGGRINGVRNKLIKYEGCLYTVTPDHNFIIDFHPDSKNILFVSPCSGHGFKHSSGVGRLVSEMIMGEKTFMDPSPFKLSRF